VDGAGRVVMRKVQAEPGPAPVRGADGEMVRGADGRPVLADTTPALRWVGTGRTVWDNKGNPVKKYEPFFSASPEYEDEADLVAWGVTPFLRHDPLGRLVRTDFPDGTLARVEFGAWRQESWDRNDTVLQGSWYADRASLPDTPENAAERRAAQLAAAHAATPAVTHLDVLGRPFLALADNGASGQYWTRTELDVEGNALRTLDARGVVVVENTFGVAGSVIHSRSADAGERRTVHRVDGKPLRTWDGRGHHVRTEYDRLHRPVQVWVRAGAGAERLTQLTVYGEGHPDAAARNLRARVFRQYDGAGLAESAAYDFKGNPVRGVRTLARSFRENPDWSSLAALAVPALDAAGAPLLEAEAFTTRTSLDALGRAVSVTAPDASEIRPVYNPANLLEGVAVRFHGGAAWTSLVEGIDYDARGQRSLVRHGNGVVTRHEYDPLTFRLATTRTTRDADGARLQDLRYTYDAVGNLVQVADAAQQTVFFDNAVVSPEARYVYDAVYRLVQADGREHAGAGTDAPRGPDDFPRAPIPHANDVNALRRYTERFGYDAVGNLLEWVHAALGGTRWTRRYAYEAGSSRLAATSIPGDPDAGPFSATYAHDAHGNVTRMPHLPAMSWNSRDELREVDLGGGARAFYAYDGGGQRIRKVVERPGSR
jgi:YD repeat-containing protein